MNKIDSLYRELIDLTMEISPYYDFDKIKSYSVYIWTHGKNGENVFDIFADDIYIYNKNHIIIEDAKPIIDKIQLKLQEIKYVTQNNQL